MDDKANNQHVKVLELPEFPNLLSWRARQLYDQRLILQYIWTCSICGFVPPNNDRHHFCNYNGVNTNEADCYPPHEKMFVIERRFPVNFCKPYQPKDVQTGMGVPAAYPLALAGLFNKLCDEGRVYGTLTPAVTLLPQQPAPPTPMLALYFWANGTREELNAEYDTDAFCEEGQMPANGDWRSLLRYARQF